MKCPHKRLRERQTLAGAAMFVLNLVFLVILAASTTQSGIPRYIGGQWVLNDEVPQYEDTDGVEVAESIWPASPPEVVEVVTAEQSLLLTTPDLYVVKEQGGEQDQDKGEASAVWKIVLVAVVLLVSIVGSLTMFSYYMCVWRGGRIHYKPQKEGYA